MIHLFLFVGLLIDEDHGTWEMVSHQYNQQLVEMRLGTLAEGPSCINLYGNRFCLSPPHFLGANVLRSIFFTITNILFRNPLRIGQPKYTLPSTETNMFRRLLRQNRFKVSD